MIVVPIQLAESNSHSMRSKMKATVAAAPKQPKERVQRRVEQTVESTDMETRLISMIRASGDRNWLAEDVRRAARVNNVERLKIIFWYVQRDTSDAFNYPIYYVDEMDSYLARSEVSERSQYFTEERISVMEQFAEATSDLPLEHDVQFKAEVLMNPECVLILERLLRDRSISSWSEAEPLLREALTNSSSLSEGTL